jgi:hypothetical protein
MCRDRSSSAPSSSPWSSSPRPFIGGKLSYRTGRRKIFVLTASVVYGLAMFALAIAGVFNIAGALPFSVASGIAPAILALGSGSYGVLYAVAGVWAIIGALAILPMKSVR